MKPSQAIPLLVQSFQNNMQIILKGDPGIGKSDVIDHASRLAKADLFTKHPSTEDPTDSRGLPCQDEINGIKVATFRPFDDLYRMIIADKLTVVHLEDFGGASPAVQKAYQQLLLRRSLNGHKLSPHVVFVISTNDTKDAAGVAGLLEPVKSRTTIIKLEVSLDDWVGWAIDHNMPPWLVAYIRSCPDALLEFKPTMQLTNSPCPRNWAEVGKWDNIGRREVEVWAGRVGNGRAAEAFAFCEAATSLPDPDACILNPDNAPLPDKASMKYAMAIAIAYRTNGRNFEQAIRYTGRIGKPFEVLTVKDSLRRDASLTKTQAFARWASDPINRDISL